MFKNIFYSLLDFLTFKQGITREINGSKIKFPPRWSRYYERDYEVKNYKFINEFVKSGMNILDVGAHIGLFSVYSSKLVGNKGKVICFEPTSGTYDILKQTLKLNKCNNVIPVRAAVSNQIGKATFFVSDTAGCNSNSLVKNKLESEITGEEVDLVTLDIVVQTYLLKPDLIKIDAEGVELDVLKGAIQTFKMYRPVLILGLHPDFIQKKGDSLPEIWNLLKDVGYKVYLNDCEIDENKFIKYSSLFDVHCFPK